MKTSPNILSTRSVRYTQFTRIKYLGFFHNPSLADRPDNGCVCCTADCLQIGCMTGFQ